MVVLAGLPRMERDLIVERTTAGLAASRARGIKAARHDVMTPELEAKALELLAEKLIALKV